MITNKPFGKDFDIDELLALSYSNRPIQPSEEPAINVYLNTRTIDLPSTFKEIAVQGDHHAERVWFAVDRYFDGEDLSEKTWIVQFINAKGEAAVSSLTAKVGGAFQGDEVESNTLRLGWDITQDVTKEAGIITFSLRCFALDENSRNITFNLGTEPVTAIVTKGLMINADSENLILKRDELSELVDRIEALYDKYYGTATNISYENIIRDTLPKIDDVTLYGGRDREHSSLDFKCADYNNLKNKPVINVDGKDYVVGGEDPIIVTKVTVDDNFNDESANPVQNQKVTKKFNEVDEEFIDINKKLDDLEKQLNEATFTPLNIISFDNDLKIWEIGSEFNGDITFSWEFIGNAKSLTLYNNTEEELVQELDINTSQGTAIINIEKLNKTTDYKLLAIDGKDKEVSKLSQVIFTYRIFYGASEEEKTTDSIFDKAFFESLGGSALQTTPQITFNTDANENGYYIYYVVPAEYGVKDTSFWAGGFQRGFGSAPIASVDYNGTIYDIWKTVNKQKDAVEITIK